MEQWLPVVGYEGLYSVSDEGRVRSEPRWNTWLTRWGTRGRRYLPGCVLQLMYDRQGYPKCSLGRDGAERQVHVHTLVLTAFIGPCPSGMEACHKENDPANVRLDNLRWDTHSNNLRDRVRHGTDPHVSRTHCPQDHEHGPDNHRNGSTGRTCLACSKAHNRLCRGRGCDHSSTEFRTAADWYYANPGKRWPKIKTQDAGGRGG